jgi:hypothetical protein
VFGELAMRNHRLQPVMGAKAAADFMAGFFAQFEIQISYPSAEIVVMGNGRERASAS